MAVEYVPVRLDQRIVGRARRSRAVRRPGLITAVAFSETVAFGILAVPAVRSAALLAGNSPVTTNSGMPAIPRARSSFSGRPKTSSAICWPSPLGVAPLSAAPSWSRTRLSSHLRTLASWFLLVGSGRSLSPGIVSPSNDAGPPTVAVPLKKTSTSPSLAVFVWKLMLRPPLTSPTVSGVGGGGVVLFRSSRARMRTTALLPAVRCSDIRDLAAGDMGPVSRVGDRSARERCSRGTAALLRARSRFMQRDATP